jgi:hypothetical protein
MEISKRSVEVQLHVDRLGQVAVGNEGKGYVRKKFHHEALKFGNHWSNNKCRTLSFCVVLCCDVY